MLCCCCYYFVYSREICNVLNLKHCTKLTKRRRSLEQAQNIRVGGKKLHNKMQTPYGTVCQVRGIYLLLLQLIYMHFIALYMYMKTTLTMTDDRSHTILHARTVSKSTHIHSSVIWENINGVTLPQYQLVITDNHTRLHSLIHLN